MPKNLATAVLVEAAEIAEHFQRLDAAESASLTEARRHDRQGVRPLDASLEAVKRPRR